LIAPMEYLALPFVLREGHLDRADLHESLVYSVGLILCTRRGSLRFDPEYGCDIWEMEYSDVMTTNKADIRSSVRNAIDRHEKRLYNVSVSVLQSGEGSPRYLGLAVKISGNYQDRDEEKKFEANYLLG